MVGGRKIAGWLCIVLGLFGYVGIAQAPGDGPLPADWFDRFVSVGGQLFIPTVLLIVGVFLLLQRPPKPPPAV